MATGQALRYALAAVVLLAAFHRYVRRPTLRELPRLLLVAGAGLVGPNALVLAAERSTDPATVGVIVGSLPIVAALVGPLAARHLPRPWIVACAAVAVVGGVLVQGAGGEVTVAGAALAAGAVVSEMAFMILAVPLYATRPTLTVSIWICVAGVAVLVAGGALFDPRGLGAAPRLEELWTIAFLALATVLAMVCWGYGLKRLGVERLGLFASATPVAALLTSVAVGVSTLTVTRAVGAVVVGLAIGAGSLVRTAVEPTPTGIRDARSGARSGA